MSDALPSGHRIVAGRAGRSVRHWLDTFDRRLLARGVELWLEPGRSGARLNMVGPETDGGAGAVGSVGRTSVDWPARVPPEVVRRADLPNEVVDRIGPMLGGRAVLLLASASVTERLDRVVDEHQKTVCRLVVQESGGLRCVLVQRLRGYEADARQVADAFDVGSESLLRLVLAESGRSDAPGSRPAGSGLDPKAPAHEGVATIVGRLLLTVESNVPGTLARYDDEFLHELRVAVRRARSALKIARDYVDPSPALAIAAELKWLGDMTTPARDLDVNLQDLPRLSRSVDPELRDALAPFARLLEAKRDKAYAGLGRALRSTRFRRLMADAPGLLSDLAPPWDGRSAESATDGPTTEDMATAAVRRAFERVVKRGKGLTHDSPDEAVHDLRKRAKELRYGIEFFAELLGSERSELVRDLKELQDVLGGFNDSVVQRAFLRDCAVELQREGAPALTILALGEMSGDIGRSGAKARAGVPDRMGRLERWGRDGRLARLLNGA